MKVKLKNGDSFIEVDTDISDDIEEKESFIEERNNLDDTIELKLDMEEYNETDGSK